MRRSYAEASSAAFQSFFFVAAAAGPDDVFLFDPLDVELAGAGDDLVEGLVVIEAGRLREARVVHARDDERLEVGAVGAARLQLLARLADFVVQLQDLAPPPLAFFHGLGNRLVQEGVDAAQNRLVRTAAQPRPFLVAGAERQERWLLELERERRLAILGRARERAGHPDCLE